MSHYTVQDYPFKSFPVLIYLSRQKGGDMSQSYDKSPYTNRNVKGAKWQHKQRHKKVQLNSNSNTQFLPSSNKLRQAPVVGGIQILAYRHLSWTVFPPLLWWIVQFYTE